ncbi:hypothetical protein MTBLM1_40164 [Rhodospirillaceae bacterium LM-1]|nr:hypothetical protein MTBLM1_40164 [Rhodospirillaceae bacterium LM-1]
MEYNCHTANNRKLPLATLTFKDALDNRQGRVVVQGHKSGIAIDATEELKVFDVHYGLTLHQENLYDLILIDINF